MSEPIITFQGMPFKDLTTFFEHLRSKAKYVNEIASSVYEKQGCYSCGEFDGFDPHEGAIFSYWQGHCSSCTEQEEYHICWEWIEAPIGSVRFLIEEHKTQVEEEARKKEEEKSIKAAKALEKSKQLTELNERKLLARLKEKYD